MLAAIDLVLGGFLILVGRKLFWLFVGAVGFAIGVEVATRFLHRGTLFTVLAAAGVGLVFAALAVLAETVAIGIAGFLGGALVMLNLTYLAGIMDGRIAAAAFLLGGVLGVGAVVLLFDWALISLSALTGASLVAGGLPLTRSARPMVFLALLLVGLLVQGFVLRAENAAAKSRTT
jgi:hypothetical protein